MAMIKTSVSKNTQKLVITNGHPINASNKIPNNIFLITNLSFFLLHGLSALPPRITLLVWKLKQGPLEYR